MLFPPSTGRVVQRLTSSQPPPAPRRTKPRARWHAPRLSLHLPPVRRLLHLRARRLPTR